MLGVFSMRPGHFATHCSNGSYLSPARLLTRGTALARRLLWFDPSEVGTELQGWGGLAMRTAIRPIDYYETRNLGTACQLVTLPRTECSHQAPCRHVALKCWQAPCERWSFRLDRFAVHANRHRRQQQLLAIAAGVEEAL